MSVNTTAVLSTGTREYADASLSHVKQNMGFYESEYADYWSRSDRWGSHSYRNVESILVPLTQCCGKGKALDIGCGMGRLVRNMLLAGVDAYGIDVSERVIAEVGNSMPGRFCLGSALAIPFEDNAFDIVVSTDCLEHLAPEDVVRAASEIKRLSRRYAYLMVCTAVDRDNRWHLTVKPREWWEDLFFANGFRRHPLFLSAVPFSALECEPASIPLVFEKDPAGADQNGLIDWGRKTGRRADAYMAFYALASKFVGPGKEVLDDKCRTGFGCAILAAANPEARILGVDSAMDCLTYAQNHYSTSYRNMAFSHLHDSKPEIDRFDLILTFQPESPDGNVTDIIRTHKDALRPGGIFLVGLPSDAVPATGRNFPESMGALMRPTEGISLKHLFSLKWEKTRSLREVKLPVQDAESDADLLILAFRKEAFGSSGSRLRRDKVVILANHYRDAQYMDLISESSFPIEFVQDIDGNWEPPLDSGLVLSLEPHDEPCLSALCKSVERDVPTLIIDDQTAGLAASDSIPKACHKIACSGDVQSRILSLGGYSEKCESVGSSDRLINLIRQMIEVGQQAREQRKPLQFPARMLPSEHSHTDLADSSDHTEANRQEAVRAFLSMLVTARASERPVYCWGAGEFGRRLIVSLGDAADKITAIIDSDPSKWGSAWGKQVCSPAVLWDREKFERPYVFIASSASSEIEASLQEKGFRQRDDYVSVPSM